MLLLLFVVTSRGTQYHSNLGNLVSGDIGKKRSLGPRRLPAGDAHNRTTEVDQSADLYWFYRPQQYVRSMQYLRCKSRVVNLLELDL